MPIFSPKWVEIYSGIQFIGQYAFKVNISVYIGHFGGLCFWWNLGGGSFKQDPPNEIGGKLE